MARAMQAATTHQVEPRQVDQPLYKEKCAECCCRVADDLYAQIRGMPSQLPSQIMQHCYTDQWPSDKCCSKEAIASAPQVCSRSSQTAPHPTTSASTSKSAASHNTNARPGDQTRPTRLISEVC